MLRIKTLALAATLALLSLSATPALAADDYTVKDSTGATITVRAKEVAGKKLTTHTVADSSGTLVDPATSDKQDTGNASLSSLDTKITATNAKLDALITALGTPASAANQVSGNSKLDSVIAALGSPLTVTLSGVSTAANQATANASLASIDSKLTGQATAASQATAAGKLDTLHNDLATGLNPPFSTTCSLLTLPGTGGTYAASAPFDLAANSATAGAVTPISCSIAKTSAGGGVVITKAWMSSSNPSIINSLFRVYLYTGVPTVTGGNDATFASSLSGHFCELDITLSKAFTDGADGAGVPVTGTSCNIVLSGTQTISALIEPRAGYAWLAGQTFSLRLEGFNQ